MSRRVPSYRRHRQSGQAIVTLTDGVGNRHDVLLGKYGSAQSRAEYARVVAEWEARGRSLAAARAHADPTVNEVAIQFWRHAEQRYRGPDGLPTAEAAEYRRALRPVVYLYGHTPAREFGPVALEAVRELMVKGYTHPKHGDQRPACRGVVNQRVGRVRRVFKWAVCRQLIPAAVLEGLRAVQGLQRGQSAARETEPVKPVPVAFVEAALPFMLPPVAALVRLQLYTGARPGELVIMRAIDLDTSGHVWTYRPAHHKTAHRGHSRIIAIGPKGQAVIRPFLKPNVEAYLFSPQEAVEERRCQQRAMRKSKVQPSQVCRKRRNPRRVPGERYEVRSYYRAVERAIRAANTARACLACKTLEPADRCESCRAAVVPHWHPHQLRHTKATELRREFGLDVARAVLGHRSPAITEVYADLDLASAIRAIEATG